MATYLDEVTGEVFEIPNHLVKMSSHNRNDNTKSFSEETRARMSASRKGRVVSKEQREAISRANTGRVMSDEAKAKLSKAKTGIPRPFSDEHCKNLSIALKKYAASGKAPQKKPHSEETKAKMSASHMGKKMPPEAHKKAWITRRAKKRGKV